LFETFETFDRLNSAVLGMPDHESPRILEFILRNEKKDEVR
jgi:hypothetical protein